MSTRCFRFLFILISGFVIGSEQRLVAIGDVHGDYDSLVSILRKTQLIDADDQWIGGDTVLVQTGDLLDRGARVRDVLDLFLQ